MTNAQIIMNESIRLMEEGVIAPTGRMIKAIDGEGKEVLLKEPEQIHTYKGWQELGFQVKRGEKSNIAFPIWKHTVKKAKEENEQDEEKMFMVNAFFFTAKQVQPLNA